MMDSEGLNPLNELDWLAFYARQRGWDNMAERISNDAAKSQTRQDELDDEMTQLRNSLDDNSDESAA